ncbi:NAD(P)-dependent oxidoreductase [Nocardia altamirensis]|uniref:NAD(P)-dependent oxidoreductase n=1 Tax=Nocardia altamirensis TaxID=472158 RepID=UPI0008406935|nr:NAD(P)-binding domain-containing protein [Nocardia altamirensis]
MTERTPVTVLGLGSMGSALAKAFLRAGHPTTVWNRSPERAASLVALGARHVGEIAEAVAASPLIVSCLIGFEATAETLAPAGHAIGGRTLITVNSGAPAGARALAAWAAEHGAGFLGGAIKNVPAAVGNPDTLLYFGGNRALFDEHAETLRVLGGDLEHLGPEPDLAAMYEAAVGATLLPALLGFFEGAAVLSARGFPASSMVRHSTKWLQMIESLLPVLAEEIDTRDYTKLGSSVALFHSANDDDIALGTETGVDMSWHRPMFELLGRAMDEGYGDKSITALFELLRVARVDELRLAAGAD